MWNELKRGIIRTGGGARAALAGRAGGSWRTMRHARARFMAVVMTVTIGLVAAGCSSGSLESADDTPTTTTVTTTTMMPTTTTLSLEELEQEQYDADVVLIKKLWRDYSDSWDGGVDAGYEYLAKNNYPAYECEVDDYRKLWVFSDGYSNEVIVDEDTIERDDGWAIPGTDIGGGQVPDGRVYIMRMSVILRTPGYDPDASDTEGHVTVGNQGAQFFIECRRCWIDSR
jgi:hypothetical protein